jgi:hypothetical protein
MLSRCDPPIQSMTQPKEGARWETILTLIAKLSRETPLHIQGV